MLFPRHRPGIEQWSELPGLHIDARDIWPFVSVAPVTAPGKIVFKSQTPVLLRDDVIEIEGEEVGPFRHEAVFASPTRPSADQSL